MQRPPQRQTFAEYLAIDKVDTAFRESVRDFKDKFSRNTINASHADRLFNIIPGANIVPDYFSNQVLGDEFQRVFAMVSNNVLSKGRFTSNDELSETLVTREWLQFVRKSFIKAIDDIIDETGQFRPYIMRRFEEEGLAAAHPALMNNDEFKWSFISSYISMFICGAEIFQDKLSKANAALTFLPKNKDESLSLYTAAKGYFSYLIGLFKEQILGGQFKVDDKVKDRVHDFFDPLAKNAPSAVQVDARRGLTKSTIAAEYHAREDELLDMYGTEIYELAQEGEAAAPALIIRFLQDRYLINLALKNCRLLDPELEGNALDLIYHPDFQPKLHAGISPGYAKFAQTRCFSAEELQEAGYPTYLIESEHATPKQCEALILGAVIETVGKLIAEVVNPFKLGVDIDTILLLRKTLGGKIEKSLQGTFQQFTPSLQALTKKYAATSETIETKNKCRYALERCKQDIREYLMNFYRTNKNMRRARLFESELLFPYNFLRSGDPSFESFNINATQESPNFFINAGDACNDLPKWDAYYLNFAVAALREQLADDNDRVILDETLRDFSNNELIHLATITNPDNQPHIAAFIKTFTELERLDVGELPGNLAHQQQVLDQIEAWLESTNFVCSKDEVESKTRECEAHVKKLKESKPVCLAYIAARDALAAHEASSDTEKKLTRKALDRVSALEKCVSINPANYFELLKQDCENTLEQLQLIKKQKQALEAERLAHALKIKEHDAAKTALAEAEATSKRLQSELDQAKEFAAKHEAEARSAKVQANMLQANLDGAYGKLQVLTNEKSDLTRQNKELAEAADRAPVPASPAKPKPSRLRVWLPRIIFAALFILGTAAIITAALYTAGIIVVPLAAIVLATKLSIAGFAVGGAMAGAGVVGAIVKFCNGLRGKKHSQQIEPVRAFSSTNADAARRGFGGTSTSELPVAQEPDQRQRSSNSFNSGTNTLRVVPVSGHQIGYGHKK